MWSLKLQSNPFPFLMYAEWAMLGSCGSLAVLEAIAGRRMPLQHISVLVVLCLMGWLLPIGKSPLKVFYTLAEIGLIFYGATLGYLHILPTLYLIVFIRSCFLFGTIGRWVVGGLSLILFLVHQTRYVQNMTHLSPQLAEEFWVHGLGLCLVAMLVKTLKSEQQSQSNLTVAHEQLRAYAFQAEELAALQERNRIAREIHDSLGHALTALNVQLQTAVLLGQEQPLRAEPFVQRARQLGITAMQEVRKSVQALRREEESEPFLTETIAALVDDFRQGNGIDARLHVHLQPTDIIVSNTIVNALYRIVQEALTNVSKYAQATAVVVEIEAVLESLRLIIVDNGQGFDRSHLDRTGFGLRGMQERVAALNGTFELETEPGQGCRIQIDMPLVEEATA
jgi:signal transduction histidine kinase